MRSLDNVNHELELRNCDCARGARKCFVHTSNKIRVSHPYFALTAVFLLACLG